MIILDTNVISACMRPAKNKAVVAWLNEQPPQEIWTTAITLFELRYGIEKLVTERRRAELDAAWKALSCVIFRDRILTFDQRAAHAAAKLASVRAQKARHIDTRDTFIAGIAIAMGATLATRNMRDFADAGIPLIDPWTARA